MDEIVLLKQEATKLLACLLPSEDSVNLQINFQWFKGN